MLSQILLILAVALFGMVAGVALVLFWAVPKIENRFVFRPMRDIFKTPADFGIPFEQHSVQTADGIDLVAWHLRPARPVGSVVYFHGNSGNLGLFNEVFRLLYHHDLQVFAVDYRGYGGSGGTPSEKGLYQDAISTVQFFRENLQSDSLPLLYWGRSLGGCFASFAAAQSPPDGLILETAFPSKKSLLKNYPQFRRFAFFSRCRLNTVDHLREQRYPVLVVHGGRDQTIPIEQGRQLFEKLSGPKDFFLIAGADHINIHRLDETNYMRRILKFVDEVRPPTVH